MADIEVGVEGVCKLLRNLKTDKAAGPDQIQPVLLKELHRELSPIITFLFKLSLDRGHLPSDWVTANVTPLRPVQERWLNQTFQLSTYIPDLYTVYSFEFAQSYFRPIEIWDWVLNSPTLPFSYIIQLAQF